MKKHQIKTKGWTHHELWQGCMLVSIAHAIFVANAPELAYANSWDGFNYSMNDSQGSRGTISFFGDVFAAGFRNDACSTDAVNTLGYFVQASEPVIELAEQETLQYLLVEDIGSVLPSVTTVLWGENGQVSSSHSFEEMLERGGHLLELQSMSPEQAFLACGEEYELTEAQLTLLKKLFQQKIDLPGKLIVLTPQEIAAIGAHKEEGIRESKISFNEIGILWE